MNHIEKTVEILNTEEQKALLTIARETINAVTSQKRPELNVQPISHRMQEKYGAFVTLRKDANLRGCIGYMQAIKPLIETIVEMAEAAALRDPRFEPVKNHEVKDLNIEISVLTPMHKIESVDEIHPGIHGLFVEKGFHKGLLLPQVASENNWDVETFLQHTLIKAGLSQANRYDENLDIYIFSAQIFTE